MKYSFLFFLMTLLLTVSCGEKGDSGKASFKLQVGNMSNATAESFTGGLLIMGRRMDDTQSFVLPFTTGLELNLQKGAWEFATIGWTAAVAEQGKMTGPQQCSYQRVELRDDLQTISFYMSDSNCVNIKKEDGSEFADSQFMKLTNASGTIGFKKLKLIVCTEIDAVGSCTTASGSSTIKSYKVIIPPSLKGINYSVAEPLSSNCKLVSSGWSSTDLTLPVGGISGFMKMNLSLYNSEDCSEATGRTQVYEHGLARPIAGFSLMFPSYSNYLSSSNYHYLGAWDSTSLPPVASFIKGDVYKVTNAIVSPAIGALSLIYFDGSEWTTLTAGQITIHNGRVYFDNDSYSYFFIKQ